MAHGKEGDGQARAKEKDEIGGQLVPEPEKVGVWRPENDRDHKGEIKTSSAPVVDGKGQVVAWCREAITTSP